MTISPRNFRFFNWVTLGQQRGSLFRELRRIETLHLLVPNPRLVVVVVVALLLLVVVVMVVVAVQRHALAGELPRQQVHTGVGKTTMFRRGRHLGLSVGVAAIPPATSSAFLPIGDGGGGAGGGLGARDTNTWVHVPNAVEEWVRQTLLRREPFFGRHV